MLNRLLKAAVEWDAIERMPATIRLLPIPRPSMGFHDFDEYERLVDAAKSTDARAYLAVLLGGEAGLRCGEMMALEWQDVDLAKRRLCVQRSEWKGQVTVPKGGRLRYVPMTVRLAGALRDHRHLRGTRVLCLDRGEPLTQRLVQGLVLRAARRAGLPRRRSRAQTLVLFAPGDAGRVGARDSGACRTPGPDDDPAVHASQPGGH